MSSPKPKLNQLYVYDSHGSFPKISTRKMQDYTYQDKKLNLVNSLERYIYRYVKDVTILNSCKSLLMISDCDDVKKVNKFFNDSVKIIESTKRAKIFTTARSTPKELDISLD